MITLFIFHIVNTKKIIIQHCAKKIYNQNSTVLLQTFSTF